VRGVVELEKYECVDGLEVVAENGVCGRGGNGGLALESPRRAKGRSTTRVPPIFAVEFAE
jgi:hypothetical protein